MTKFIIPYHITDEDYVAFNDHHLRHTPYGRKVVRNGRVALVALSVFILIFFWFQHQDLSILLWQAIGMGAVCLFSCFFFHRSMMRTIRRRVQKSHKTGKELFSPRGELTVDFENRTITDKGEKFHLEVPFSSVQEMYETDTAFYIYIHQQGGFIIPYHLFLRTDELAAFRKSAKAAFQP